MQATRQLGHGVRGRGPHYGDDRPLEASSPRLHHLVAGPADSSGPGDAPRSARCEHIAPTPTPGDKGYEASWANGLVGWTGSPEWKVVGGTPVSDGSDKDYSTALINAPYRPRDQI